MSPYLPRARRTAVLILSCILSSPFASLVHAAADNYTGGSGTTNWSATADWSLAHAPAAGDDANIKFNDGTNRTVNLDVSSNNLNSLTLDQAGSGLLTFSQTANVNLTAATVTIGALGAATYNQSNGNLTTTLLDTTNGNGNPSTLNLTGSGKININANGTVKIGDLQAANFIQNGASTTVTLNSANLFIGIIGGAGSYAFSAGNLTNSGSGSTLFVGFSDQGLFNQSGGTVNLPGGVINIGDFATGVGTYNLSTPGNSLTASTLIVGNSGSGAFNQSFGNAAISTSITFGVSSGSSGNYSLSGGNLTVPSVIIGQAGQGDFNQSGGNHTIASNLTIGSLSGSAGSYELLAGTLTAPLENVGLSGDASFTQTGGNNNITAGGQLNVGGNVADATYFLHGGNISLSIGAALNNFGTLDMAGGNVTGAGNIINSSVIVGFGAIAVSGIFTNTGVLTQQGGILSIGVLTGSYTNSGEMDLSLPGQLKINAFFTNNGTINLNGGQLSTGGGLLTNSGLLVGPGTISFNFDNSSSGLLSVPAGTTSLPGSTNEGLIQLTSTTSQLNTGGLLQNTGTLQGIGSVTGSNIVNSGTIESLGGTLVIAGTLSNNSGATLRASSGNKLLILQGLPTNAGLISLTGGTFDNNNHPLNNTGQITGFGTFSTGGAGLTNNGSITFTGSGGSGTTTINGPVTNSANQTLNIKFQPAIFTGNITNNGTIKTTSTTVTFTGNYTGNTFLSDPATNIFQGTATVIPGGLMTGSTGDVFNFSGPAFTNNGTFQNGGALLVSSAVINNASFTQSGPQTWSAGATFTNNAGLATFRSNAKIYGLTITAGTVDITASKLVIEATPAAKSTTLNTLHTYLASHSLTSSTLPPNFALALLDNSVLNKTSFGNQSTDPNSLLLSPELLGDANIDGKVDLTDLSIVLNNFGTTTTAWTNGNFDNQSSIDLTDLSTVLNNFGLSNPNASSQSSASPAIPTPEPAAIAFLFPTIAFLFRRKNPTK